VKVVTPLEPELVPRKTEVTVFLAGGISNCPDWQKQLTSLIRTRFGDPDDLLIYNPRRALYHDNSDIAKQQITWERKHLKLSHIILFWFPCETLCPITLFEYGYWLAVSEVQNKPRLLVGCHPEYARRLDLEVQTSLSHSSLTVRDSWEDLLNDFNEEYSYVRHCRATTTANPVF